MTVNACVQEQADGLSVKVHAQPGAAKSAITGVKNDELLVKVAAPAREGEANTELCAFLARFFQVPKTAVQVVRGKTSRHKAVFIRGDARKLLSYIDHLLS